MLPVILQQLITIGINFMDNLMVGSFGETQIAAAALGNQFYSFFQFICMGLGSGAVVMSSQFWGRKEFEPMKTTAGTTSKGILRGAETRVSCFLPTAALCGSFPFRSALWQDLCGK